MSEHFRKEAPHYEFSSVRCRLEEWLEDQSSGTLFGPKGCGKDTFLRDYFNEEMRLKLASRTENPLVVLVMEGATLTHRKDLDDLLRCIFQDGFAYLQEHNRIAPALAPVLTCCEGALPQSCALEWKKRRYCFVLVVLGFHNFICNIDDCRTDSVQQVNILKNSDAPLRMIVTNDYLYTTQYCPAMEDLAGSSIFNNLSINQFTFSKNRPRPQEFSQYLSRIYRAGDTSPFTPEEERWLLEMTGGFPAIVPDTAEALLMAKEDGLTGQEAFHDCLLTCMSPEETVYLLLSQWLKDLDDQEYNILTQISKFGIAGADEEDVDRPQSVQRGLVYTDRRSRRWRLCIGLLREMLASDRWNPRHTAHKDPEPAQSAAASEPTAPVINNYYFNAPVSSTNVAGDLHQVNNNLLVTSREDWNDVFNSLYQLSVGEPDQNRLADSLGKIQYLPEDASEEESAEWLAENQKNMTEGLDELLANQGTSLDDMFAKLLEHANPDLYPAKTPELVQRLPDASALVLKQGVIVDRLFTGLLHSFGLDDKLDFSPCGLMYSILLEQRMKETILPLYQRDEKIGNWQINKSKRNSPCWNTPRLKMNNITIGNFYGGLDGALFSARMTELTRRTPLGRDAAWWNQMYRDMQRAGDLRNNSAHQSRLPPAKLDELRSVVLGLNGDVSTSLLNRLGVFCQLDAALGYHNPNQLSIPRSYMNKTALAGYTDYTN